MSIHEVCVLLIASDEIKYKLKAKHDVDFMEVEEAFSNFAGFMMIDDRAQHKTRPSTVWFLSETYDGRLLKVVMIPYEEKQLAVLV